MLAARGRWSGALVVVTAASLFGMLGTLSRFAYDGGLTPFAWVAWRAAIGAAALWVVIASRRGIRSSLDGLRSAAPAARRWLALAVLAGAFLNLAIFVAFERTTIALALLGFYTYPAMVAAASGLLGHERLDVVRRVALLLALGGMVAVVAGGLAPGTVTVDALGIGLALVAAACQTTFVVASRGYASIRTEEAMGSILVGSAAIAVVLSAIVDGPPALVRPLGDPGLLALLAFVGLFAAALPSFLFLTGIRVLGPVRAGILMLFEPVVGVTLAAAVLGEGVTPLQAAGGATILLAAALVQRRTAVAGGGRTLVDVPVAPAPGGP
ncbi:MAG TPA: EamA family transporter [Candidatus Limnocylindrales bacterium]|nr:EamA family transporter [Candidatus Limnocylindrales bacterium]